VAELENEDAINEKKRNSKSYRNICRLYW